MSGVDLYRRDSGLSFAVYAYAASVLARTRQGRGVGSLTRDEARRMLCSLSAENDFDAKNATRLRVGAAELTFVYAPERRALKCFAPVKQFSDEEDDADFDAGGGALACAPDGCGLCLKRTYAAAVTAEEFRADMKRLAEASLKWGVEVAGRPVPRAPQNNYPVPAELTRRAPSAKLDAVIGEPDLVGARAE